MKKYLVALFFFLFILGTFAQTDQELVYGTYFGGEEFELLRDIVTDQQGSIYLVGRTVSVTGIATSGTHQDFYNGGTDGFIAKFDTNYNLLWSTYFGGENFDEIYSIEVLSDGSFVVVGKTTSESDISTIGAFQEEIAGPESAFISRFSSEGDLMWSTYFGGSTGEWGLSVVVVNDTIFIAGRSHSEGMATPDVHQEIFGGITDGFIASFTSAGELLWNSYYGGEDIDIIFDIDINDQNELLLFGHTTSETNIASVNAYQEIYSGSFDCFIVKFTLSGERVWGTYYGGSGFDEAFDIDSDSQGNIIVSGYTQSNSGIATPGAHKTINESSESFLASFNTNGQINWGTYFGGSSGDFDSHVYVNDSDIYYSGITLSDDGIIAGSPYQPQFIGEVIDFTEYEIYLTKFNSEGQQVWGTYYGNTGSDMVSKIAMIDNNTIALVGTTNSTEGIVTPDALNSELNGFADGLFAVFDVDLLTSINEIKPGELNLYPNPANNYFILNLPLTLPGKGMVEIYTLEGKRMAVFENYISGNRIPLDLAPGMYIVSYRLGDIDLRTKLLVN